jgi:hypothetical protein
MNRTAKYVIFAAIAGLTLASASLGGCAEPQASPLAQHQSSANGKRLFYIGLALYSEPWSENDVVELSDKLRTTSRFHVVPMIASNVVSAQNHYPVANDTNIAAMVHSAAAEARAGDVVFVYISTHGSHQVLARKVGNNPPTALPSRELARKLAPLAGHQSVIIISACYSGSLISDLRSPDRIIITAARADRSSFGCAAGNRHTFFGAAELDAFDQRGRSLHQVFAATRDEVAHMESARQFQPSEPQVSVGAEVADLYDAPLF